MSDSVEAQIKKLCPNVGDIVVMTLPADANAAMCNDASRALHNALPFGCVSVILTADTKIELLPRPDLQRILDRSDDARVGIFVEAKK